ncbi:class I SAM-dependent methyltransferase [Piscinibacter koreensis]|uniref:Methyltransferase domain-containing protein n=1 Tax=Piscinibacter koreensis TaxID=2742824 RepID=A0A7Y6TW61_9BURK|nr:class I SAM-dependent methyltransferase [Schlegelella koreensis]NUZ05794.1 methyltransferase domain-containing protein [Schlegelella koreensis]
MVVPIEDIQRIVDGYLRQEASAAMVLMELIQRTEDPEAVAQALPGLHGDAAKLAELARHLAAHREGCDTIVRMIRQRLDSPELARDAEEGIERARKLFDASVAQSEESSVALYSLGSPELLAAATDEVIGVLDDWGVLGVERDALEIGCGIGRLMAPLCARVRSVVGTDVSPGMIAAATRRLAGFSNARVVLTSGQDLSAFGSASMDLVYSVDTFPYLVLGGPALVERHFREVRRVLRPGGDFVLFNYAYGLPRDEADREVRALAQGADLEIVRADESPFRIWNGIGWLLRRG